VHIQNSLSLLLSLFLAQNTHVVSRGTYPTFKTREQTPDELKKTLGEEETRGTPKVKKKPVESCRNRMTVGVLWLESNLLGVNGVALYDGVRSFVLMPAIGGLI